MRPTGSWPGMTGSRTGRRALVLLVVGAADAARLDAEERVVGADLGQRELAHLEGARGGLDDGARVFRPAESTCAAECGRSARRRSVARVPRLCTNLTLVGTPLPSVRSLRLLEGRGDEALADDGLGLVDDVADDLGGGLDLVDEARRPGRRAGTCPGGRSGRSCRGSPSRGSGSRSSPASGTAGSRRPSVSHSCA